MAQQLIQIGAVANDKTGDPLRSAFTKINQNFTELYGGAAAADIGDFKIFGSTLATQGATPETWGNTGIYLDPMGEGNNWIYVPNQTQAGTGSRLELKGEQGVNVFAGNSGMKWQFYDDTFNEVATLEFPSNEELSLTAGITHRHGDFNIKTLRNSFDVDADIGIYAADDLWLEALGDEVSIRAGNNITLQSATAPTLSNNTWAVTSGSWINGTLTFTTTEPGAVTELLPFIGSNGYLWFKINDNASVRWVYAFAYDITENAGTYTLLINENSQGITYTATDIKLQDLSVPLNPYQWQFGTTGDLQLPYNGGIKDSNGNYLTPKASTVTPVLYNVLTSVVSDPPSNPNWLNGTGVSGGVSNANISFSISSGTPSFTINDPGLPGRYVGETIFIIQGSVLGGTDGIDDMNINVSAVANTGSGVIDLTKQTHILESGDYTLANGYEGQVLYFVLKSGATNVFNSIWVRASNMRYINPNDATTSEFTNAWWAPFYKANDNYTLNGVATAVFADGAWNLTGGILD